LGEGRFVEAHHVRRLEVLERLTPGRKADFPSLSSILLKLKLASGFTNSGSSRGIPGTVSRFLRETRAFSARSAWERVGSQLNNTMRTSNRFHSRSTVLLLSAGLGVNFLAPSAPSYAETQSVHQICADDQILERVLTELYRGTEVDKNFDRLMRTFEQLLTKNSGVALCDDRNGIFAVHAALFAALRYKRTDVLPLLEGHYSDVPFAYPPFNSLPLDDPEPESAPTLFGLISLWDPRGETPREATFAELYHLRGLQAYENKELNDAEHSFLMAVRSNPAHKRASFNLACVYARQGKVAASVRYLQVFKMVHPDNIEEKVARDSDFDAVRDNSLFRKFLSGQDVDNEISQTPIPKEVNEFMTITKDSSGKNP
jgi:hypothetical protein